MDSVGTATNTPGTRYLYHNGRLEEVKVLGETTNGVGCRVLLIQRANGEISHATPGWSALHPTALDAHRDYLGFLERDLGHDHPKTVRMRRLVAEAEQP